MLTARDLVTDRVAGLDADADARAAEAAILFVPHVIRSASFAPFAISIAH